MIHLPSAGTRSDAYDDQPGALRREVHHVHLGTIGHLHGDACPALGVRARQTRGDPVRARVVRPPREFAGAQERRGVGSGTRVMTDDLGQGHAALATNVTIKARALEGRNWSALNEAVFTAGQ